MRTEGGRGKITEGMEVKEGKRAQESGEREQGRE